MLVRRSLLVAALAISVARCGDQPTAARPAGLQLLDWADTTALFSATGALASGPASATGSGAYQTAPVNLDHTHIKVWAVRGATRSVLINYKGTRDVDAHPFLLLTTTDPQFVPGIGELAVGDSVLITIKVDPRKLKVSLEPTGLQFGAPAQLTIWYGGAANNPNGDSTSNVSDTTLAGSDLGLFYREDHQHPWIQLAATQSLEQQSFTYPIPHFSDYAVAKLMEWAVSW